MSYKNYGSEVKEFACLKIPNVELTHGSLKEKFMTSAKMKAFNMESMNVVKYLNLCHSSLLQLSNILQAFSLT